MSEKKDRIHVYHGFTERSNLGLLVSYQRDTKDGFDTAEKALEAIAEAVKSGNDNTWIGTYKNPGALPKGIHSDR